MENLYNGIITQVPQKVVYTFSGNSNFKSTYNDYVLPLD